MLKQLTKVTKWFVFVVLSLLVLTVASYSLARAGDEKEHWDGQTSVDEEHVHESTSTEVSTESGEIVTGVPCVGGFAGPYPCKNVDLLSYLPLSAFHATTSGDIWGWTDSETGKEYAVISHGDAVSFVDISEPTMPVFVGYLPAPVHNILWRDVKVYNNHAYVVGDGSRLDRQHGLQIFDLTQLRDATVLPTEFSDTSRYLDIGQAHNIQINEETGVAYIGGSRRGEDIHGCNGAPHAVDLEDPANPVFLGCIGTEYMHDADCVVYKGPDNEHWGKEICVTNSGGSAVMSVWDVTDKSNPVRLARKSYPGAQYSHQGSLTADHTYFAMGDELDEMFNLEQLNTHTYLWDLSDLDNPVHFSTYVGPTAAIDHNLYFRDDYLFEANYSSGLRILDASNIANGNLSEIAYFDTHPVDDATVFAGAWSSYPYFESGVVIISNIEDGLYVVKPHLADIIAVGGGWLQDSDGSKINFGFEVERTLAGPEGELSVNDKAGGVKIKLSQLTYVGDVLSACGSVPVTDDTSVEIQGSGTYNGNEASFRACVADNGEPGKNSDLFYVECTDGCTYDTGSRAADDVIEAGNVDVRRGPQASESGELVPTTSILKPVLRTEGIVGELETFSVIVYDQNQNLLADATVTLEKRAADGTVETLTAVTDVTGTAVFTTANLEQPTEYVAVSGNVRSNAVQVSP